MHPKVNTTLTDVGEALIKLVERTNGKVTPADLDKEIRPLLNIPANWTLNPAPDTDTLKNVVIPHYSTLTAQKKPDPREAYLWGVILCEGCSS
jgi:hypothetical protein